MKFEVEGIALTEEDKNEILKQAQEIAQEKGETLEKIKIWVDKDGYLSFQPFFNRRIRRIRRITGYFSEIKNFNDAKKAELRDRVAHL